MPGKKILVADDSLTIQKVIRLSLTHEGYDIHAVSDGNDALQQIAVIRPDLVLIDVSLPGKSAFEVKRELNVHEDLQHVRFVLMSGAYEKLDELQIAEVKFDAKLIKPIDPAELRKILSQTLGNSPSLPAETLTPLNSERPSPTLPPLPSLSPGSVEAPKAELPQGLLEQDTALPDIPLELPPELQAELHLSEGGEIGGLSLEMPPPLATEGEDLKIPVQPQEVTPLPPPLTESVEKLWEEQEEKTLSELILNSDLSVNAPSSRAQSQEKPGATPPSPSQDQNWSVSDAQRSPLAAASFKPEAEPLLPSPLPEELQSSSPMTQQSLLKSPVQSSSIENFLKETPPLPISAEQIESLIQQQIQNSIEKLTQQMLPEIAEKIVKQEIHRLLSEPETK